MLYEYYGETCPHCISMKPVIEEVEKELGVSFEKIEVWNNEANAQKLESVDRGRCGGVPFFLNDESNEFICGAASKEDMMKLAKGEKV
jgi:thiol-disulfide isomerase/thioredoxin